MSRFIVPGLIIGSQVHIAKFGTAIGSGDQAKKVLAARPPDHGGSRSLALHGQDPHQQPSD